MRLLPILLILFSTITAQTFKQCKQRFDDYLNLNGKLSNTVKFEKDAIYLLNKNGEKSFAIYNHEIEMLADFFENTSFLEQEKLLKQKQIKKYSKRQRDSIYIYIDDTRKIIKTKKSKALFGLKVAIDPGHFSTNLAEASIEQKYLFFLPDSLKNPNDTIKIFESDLNFITASYLKNKLEQEGATVYLTKTKANYTSFNCTYNYWLIHHKKRMLDSLKSNNSLSDERYNKLIKLHDYKFFWEFFRDFDLINRAQKINTFNPHLSIIIHHNVDEKNEPWKKVTNKNFTMTFIGGAFTESNLDKIDAKINFLRLLLSKQLNQSEKLSSYVVSNFSKALQIPIAAANDADYLKDNCISLKTEGVFSRNLILCRTINSPLVYGEALYQDNALEVQNFNAIYFNLPGLKRLEAEADCYFNAIFKFYKENF
ncbi:MAG: N-acetylmuramoyl-L-alanine amidase [Bacteroidetes bacterium]|nr:N-acetylmuramoyl-L-alanine amidase [Bacteroidota bacterium]